MTPNEKELLELFKGVAKANAFTMGKKMYLSVDYTQTLCNRLAEKGLLSIVTPGRWPVYKSKGKK
ncbi:hypothetical protein MYX78_01880 [Acidobacteria bacterium AH-259-G07]|nr:hypothetical protein [Acidobacteria bacterium AH-259-G07]